MLVKADLDALTIDLVDQAMQRVYHSALQTAYNRAYASGMSPKDLRHILEALVSLRAIRKILDERKDLLDRGDRT